MNKLITFRNSVLAGMLCLVTVSCSDEGDTDNRLPEGKYPMTFATAVEGTTVTRATADNTWTGGEEVAIQIGGETKKYQAAAGGNLSIAGGATPFYWQNTDNITVNAWYPYNGGTKPADDALRVKADQNQDNDYQASDYLEAVDATVAFSSPVLTFTHRTAKVAVTLVAGNGVGDVSTATVTFLNQSGVEGDGNEVTPKTETKSGATTYTALLVPQQMQGKQFIKVALGGYDYFYTPTETDDANLTAGKKYTYNITVKKEGLQVESVSASWDGVTSEDEAVGATFKVHLADFTAPANTSDYKVTNAAGEELTAEGGAYSVSDEINISLSANESYRLKTFLANVDAGICKRKIDYTAATRTYTYTFYDIRSDLWLNEIQAEVMDAITCSEPQVGDYYYSDGTWSAEKNNEKICIGIVFKVGSAGDDNLINYGRFFAGEAIHGYVVALQDALSTAGNWGKRGVETPIDNVDSPNVTAYTGYSDTKTIISTYSGGSTWNDYQAFKAVVDYRSSVSAPGTSSDWYLPSLAQLGDVYNALSTIRIPLTTVGNDFQRENDRRYWTSSEKTNHGWDAWYITMGNGSKTSYAKDGTNYSRACYVRAILTF